MPRKPIAADVTDAAVGLAEVLFGEPAVAAAAVSSLALDLLDALGHSNGVSRGSRSCWLGGPGRVRGRSGEFRTVVSHDVVVEKARRSCVLPSFEASRAKQSGKRMSKLCCCNFTVLSYPYRDDQTGPGQCPGRHRERKRTLDRERVRSYGFRRAHSLRNSSARLRALWPPFPW